MPVLPAFFRQVIRKRPESRSSKSRSKTYRVSPGSSNLAYRNARSTKGKKNDPYLLGREYEELDDLERGHRLSVNMKGTTTTIVGPSNQRSLLEQSFRALQDNQISSPLVSRNSSGHIASSRHGRKPCSTAFGPYQGMNVAYRKRIEKQTRNTKETRPMSVD